MSRTFTIENRDYYEEKQYIFRRKQATIEPGVTVLVGCNGTGKTTLIDIIKRQLEDHEIKYISYNNLRDGGTTAREKAMMRDDYEFVTASMCSSEGENISLNLGRTAIKIGNYIRSHIFEKELWVLLDAVDSGLSIDNIIELKGLFDLIIKDNKNKDIYIVISANEYELAREEQCFDVYNSSYITFKDYEDYRKFIIKSRERKDKRYKTKE